VQKEGAEGMALEVGVALRPRLEAKTRGKEQRTEGSGQRAEGGGQKVWGWRFEDRYAPME
jgi:hypothetical protein